jgi:hypothetical protein
MVIITLLGSFKFFCFYFGLIVGPKDLCVFLNNVLVNEDEINELKNNKKEQKIYLTIVLFYDGTCERNLETKERHQVVVILQQMKSKLK